MTEEKKIIALFVMGCMAVFGLIFYALVSLWPEPEVACARLCQPEFWRTAKLNTVVDDLQKGVGGDYLGPDGNTPLHLAARFSPKFRAFSILFRYGAENVINQPSQQGLTPLHMALLREEEEKTTTNTGAGNDTVNRQIVAFLLNRGADPGITDQQGNNALHLSISTGDLDIVRTIIDSTPKLDTLNRNGFTPLQIAVDENRTNLIPVLIQAGASLYVRDHNGDTVLHTALHGKKSSGLAKFLVKKGAEVSARNNRGATPLHVIAASGRNIDFANELINLGAEIDALDNDLNSPLHIAARNKQGVTIVGILLNRHARTDLRDKKGMRAIDYAKKNPSFQNTDILVRLTKLSQ